MLMLDVVTINTPSNGSLESLVLTSETKKFYIDAGKKVVTAVK